MGVKSVEEKKSDKKPTSRDTRPVATSRLFNQGKNSGDTSIQLKATARKDSEAGSKKSSPLNKSSTSEAAPQGVIITTRQQSTMLAVGTLAVSAIS